MPEAKLLSRNEQATAGDSPLLESTTASAAIAQALLFNVFAFFLLAFNLLRAPMSLSKRTGSKPRLARLLPPMFERLFLPSPSFPRLVSSPTVNN